MESRRTGVGGCGPDGTLRTPFSAQETPIRDWVPGPPRREVLFSYGHGVHGDAEGRKIG